MIEITGDKTSFLILGWFDIAPVGSIPILAMTLHAKSVFVTYNYFHWGTFWWKTYYTTADGLLKKAAFAG